MTDKRQSNGKYKRQRRTAVSMAQKQKKKKAFGIFHAAVNTVTDAIYSFVKKSFIGKFFRSGDRLSALVKESVLIGFILKAAGYVKDKLKRRPKRVVGTEEFGRNVGIYNEASVKYPLKTRITGAIESSFLVNAFKSLLLRLVALPMMSVGIFLLAFGMSVTATQAITLFLSQTPLSAILTLGQGIIVLLFSLPALMNRDQTVYDCLRGGIFGSFLIFSVMGCSHEKQDIKKSDNQFGVLLFCLGLLCGILTFRFSVVSILLFLLILICAVRVFFVPEFGVLLLIFIAPLYSLTDDPALFCALTVTYVGVCYFIKAAMGKRTIGFTFLDFWVLLIALLTVFSVQNTSLFKDSLMSSLVSISFMLAYFVIKNLIKSKEWVERSVNAFLASSLYVAIFALIQSISTLSLYTEGVFASEHTLAWYMSAAFIVSMSKALSSAKYKPWYLILMILQLACVFVSGSVFAMLVLAAAVVAFFMIYSRKTVAIILLLILLIPVVSCLVSGSDVSKFITFVTYSDVSQSYKVQVWGISLKVIRDHLIFGIGTGQDVFMAAFSSYTSSELPVPANSMSLLLQILLQIGIFGSLFFAAVLIIYAVRTFTVYCKKRADKEYRICSLGIFFAICAMMVSGVFTYVWEEPIICLMFWVLLGLSESMTRIADMSTKQHYDYLESISSDVTIPFGGI